MTRGIVDDDPRGNDGALCHLELELELESTLI